MSTILDALKKSEQERKLNNVPTLSDMPVPQEVARWPVILLLLLIFIVVLVIGWFVVDGRWISTGQANAVSAGTIVIDNETVLAGQEVSGLAADDDAILVSVISYAEDPLARFAIIDGKLFRENEFVKAGVKVESILLDSVTLIERGKRVSRQP